MTRKRRALGIFLGIPSALARTSANAGRYKSAFIFTETPSLVNKTRGQFRISHQLMELHNNASLKIFNIFELDNYEKNMVASVHLRDAMRYTAIYTNNIAQQSLNNLQEREGQAGYNNFAIILG